MNSVLLDDADDTTCADRETGLTELLCEAVERRLRIEESVANDLANDLLGADMVALGASLVAKETCATVFTIEFEQLKISLSAEAELPGCLGGADPFALALDEHGEAGDYQVIGMDGELSGGTRDSVARHVELHGWTLRQDSIRRKGESTEAV